MTVRLNFLFNLLQDGVVADVEAFLAVHDQMFQAGLEVIDAHGAELAERWKFFELDVFFDRGLAQHILLDRGRREAEATRGGHHGGVHVPVLVVAPLGHGGHDDVVLE